MFFYKVLILFWDWFENFIIFHIINIITIPLSPAWHKQLD